MSRYFFDVHDGRARVDVDGIELANASAARSECSRLAGCAIAGAGVEGESDLAGRFEVLDRSGRVQIRMVFTMAEMRTI